MSALLTSVRTRPLVTAAFLGVLAVAALLRLWAPDIGSFGGDETWTVLLAYEWLDRGVVPTTSLVTSFGMATPPLEVWLAAALLAVDRDMIWMTVGNAVLGVAGVAAAFGLARRGWGTRAGLLAMAASAVFLILVVDSRRPWDLGLLPLPIVLTAWAALEASQGRRWMLAATGAGFAILMQINPQCLALLPGLAATVLLGWRRVRWWELPAGVAVGMIPAIPWAVEVARDWGTQAARLQDGASGSSTSAVWPFFTEALLPSSLGHFVNVTEGNILPWAAWADAAHLATLALVIVASLLVLPGLRRPGLTQAGTVLLLTGTWGGVLFYAIAPFQLYWHYVIAIMPLVAILLGVGLDQGLGLAGRLSAGPARLTTQGLLVAAGLFFVATQTGTGVAMLRYVEENGATFGYDIPLRITRQAIAEATALAQAAGTTVTLASGKDIARPLALEARRVQPLVSTDEDSTLVLRPGPGGAVLVTTDDRTLTSRWARDRFAPYEHWTKRYATPEEVIRVYAIPPDALPPATSGEAFANGLVLGPASATATPRAATAILPFRVGQPSGGDVTLFSHWLDPAGALRAQQDAFGFRAPDWREGDQGVAFLTANLADVPAGPLRLALGMYGNADGRRIPLEDGRTLVETGVVIQHPGSMNP